LNYDEAMAGLDLIVYGVFRREHDDINKPMTRRFIERLLDQLDHRGRLPMRSERIFLFRSIQNLQKADFKGAVANGFHAAVAGDSTLIGVLDEPDVSVSLRDELSRASNS
jgi:hypothetical protein